MNSKQRHFLLKATAISTALVCAPFLITQGIYIGLRTPTLADAAGEKRGVVKGNGEPFRILIVGESSVAGVGAETHAEALTGQLAANLAARTGRTIEWEAVARSGATVKIAHQEIVPQLAGKSADLLIIAIGGNDILRLQREEPWLADLEAFVSALREQVGDIPTVFSAIPRYREVTAFPSPLKQTFHFFGRMLFSAAQQWKADDDNFHILLPDVDIDDSMLCCDRFHLNPKGYGLWADWLAKEIAPLIARKKVYLGSNSDTRIDPIT